MFFNKVFTKNKNRFDIKDKVHNHGIENKPTTYIDNRFNRNTGTSHSSFS